MGPTCSIIFENEPMEKRLLTEKPRKMTTRFFSLRELTISIVQGLVITAGVLLLYKVGMDSGLPRGEVRTIAFATILLSNIFLTLVNRSFYYSVFTTLRYRNWLIIGAARQMREDARGVAEARMQSERLRLQLQAP